MENKQTSNRNYIAVEEFKRLTNGGFDFYDYVMRKSNTVLKRYNNFQLLNPFYDDKIPGMSIDKKNGEYLFHDFGDELYKGDVINFAGFYYNLDAKKDLPEILKRACTDLCINSSNDKQITSKMPVEPSKTVVNIRKKNDYALLKFREYYKKDISFWSQYGITVSILKKYNVSPVELITRNEDDSKEITLYKYSENDPMYAYRADDRAFQAYRPFNEKYKFRWYSIKPDNFIFGYEQLPATSDFIIITGGQKDVLSLVSHGFPAVALNSETAKLPDWLYKILQQRFQQIIIMYDIDKTGLKQSEKLSKEQYFVEVILPDELKAFGKDISDFFKQMILETNPQLFNIGYLKKLISTSIKEHNANFFKTCRFEQQIRE